MDPYARAVTGTVDWDEACFSHRIDDPSAPNVDDSAPHVPKSVVVNPFFHWGNAHAPGTPLVATIIYKVHVQEIERASGRESVCQYGYIWVVPVPLNNNII